MAGHDLTAADLDYVQRIGTEPPQLSSDAPLTEAPPALRNLQRLVSIGRLQKPNDDRRAESFRLVTEDMLVGLYNYRVPIAFEIGAERGKTLVRIGTWLPTGVSADGILQNFDIVQSSLRGLYPSISIADEQTGPRQWTTGGMVLGVPTAKPPDMAGAGLPLDRIIRALAGMSWTALVLAQPVEEATIRDLRLQLINEMRSAATGAQAAGTPSPLTDHYVEFLKDWAKSLTHAQAIGAWRTAAYLMGDAESYHQLASVWRGVFAGPKSLPEPVRIWDRTDVPMLAERWAMPDPIETTVPGLFGQPFTHQTLLTSMQLSAYVHLPEVETNGFEIRTVPNFDVVPPRARSERVVEVGEVLDRGHPTGADFTFDVDRLTRHAFVTGVTGSGKTNTVFNLLRQLDAAGVPYLVVEPAKTEYRALLTNKETSKDLRVFTLGDETISPFRLNPFEVPEGIPVAVHLDLLRSVFSVSFGMWTPLPQVLEICLHRIYLDRGWDVTTNSNSRLDNKSDRSVSFPTLTDLVAMVDQVSAELGYEERVTADIRAALRTRLNSLRTGGKGRMLDTSSSIPMDFVLGAPTILELERLGDDDDKAFLMGLVLIRLAEHRRVIGDTDGLKNVLVIEEAHRLLGQAGAARSEMEGDVRGKAVETFTNLLSEIRAYGQGVVVIDQIPAKLAPDVVKNTNLKIAHRIVAGDDRAVLGAAMAMDGRQQDSLATLSVGQAAVFTEGEDAPLLIQVPRTKGGENTWPADLAVHEAMADRADMKALTAKFLPTPDCDFSCLERPEYCELARQLIEQDDVRRALSRMVLSAVLAPESLERTWPQFVQLIDAARLSWVEHELLVLSLVVHGPAALAAQRGARARWTYTETRAMSESIRSVLKARSEGRDDAEAIAALRRTAAQMQGGQHGPFLGCRQIWPDGESPCQCRHPVAELVESRSFDGFWSQASQDRSQADPAGRQAIWDVCQDAAYHLADFPNGAQDAGVADAAMRVALCFGQQMLATRTWSHPRTQRIALDALIALSGVAVSEPADKETEPKVTDG